MMNIGEVQVFNDDEEIIEVLATLPKVKELGDLTLLQFLQEKTREKDFGTVYFVEHMVYVLYKFDPKLHQYAGDAGLLLTISDRKYAMEQLEIWKGFSNAGMVFSPKLFKMFDDYLTGAFFTQLCYDQP